MRLAPLAQKRVMAAAVAGVTVLALLSAATPAGADSTFTFSRVAGADRYGTAGKIAAQAFNPSGSASLPTVLIANGLPGHQSDALASPFLEAQTGASGAPILFVDGSATLPANTRSALTQNGTRNVIVIGGPAAVNQSALSGYTVTATYSGNSRWDTMKAIDEASGTTVGTTTGTGGTPVKTAVLASGDDSHLIDALGAGALSFADKLPMILTESSSSTLVAQASSTISDLGIQKLIVVGGPAAVPPSQYANLGLQLDTSATTGADRSATARLLGEEEIAKYGFSNKTIGVATGATFVGGTTTLQNDGADALASAPLMGTNKWPLAVTVNPTTAGDAATFAKDEASTLASPPNAPAFGGRTALPDATVSTVQQAGGGGPFPAPANVSVAANPPSVLANGSSKSTVTVTVTDAGGAPISGDSVTLSTVGNPSGACGTLSPTSGSTDSSGQLTSTYTASNTVGSCTITAKEAKFSQSGSAVVSQASVTVGVAANPSTLRADGTSTSAITATVTAANGQAVSGDSVNFSTTGSPPAACGSLSPSSGTTDSSGQVTSTYTASSTAGTCQITATEAQNGRSGSTTITQTSTAVTALPQLTSAAITGITSSGTSVQYVFSQDLGSSTTVVQPSGFKVYDLYDNEYTATTAAVDSSNHHAVDAVFASTAPTTPSSAPSPGSDLTTSAGAGNLTLATVAGPQSAGGPAVATSSNGQSPDGSAPIGTAASGTPAAAGYTSAPNPESWTADPTPGTVTSSTSTVVHVMFDRPVYTQIPACTSSCATGYPTTYPTDGSSYSQGFDIVLATSGSGFGGATEEPCFGPSVGHGTSAPPPSGNDTTNTLTIVCPTQANPSGPLSPSAIARVIVQPDAVGTAQASTTVKCPTPPLTGPGTGETCNPLESADSPRESSQTTTAPDTPTLTSVQFTPGASGAPDQITYTFDRVLATSTSPAPNKFLFYRSDGTQVTCSSSIPPGPSPTPYTAPCTAGLGANGISVVVTVGTTATTGVPTGSGETLGATGASVVPGAVSAGSPTPRGNWDDELGATNPNNPGTTRTPGTVNAPQLQRVQVSGSGAVYTFSQPVALATTGGLHLYKQDGSELTCSQAAASSNQVTCSSFGSATASDISAAVFGTADFGSVTGAATLSDGSANPGSGNSNPEGGTPTG